MAYRVGFWHFPISPMTTALSSFDSLIASRSLLKHPFYVKWSKGELTLDDLRIYAKEYFHLVERIPGVVARVAERVADAELKGQILQNMVEEQEHVELWKRFAKSLGLSGDELTAHVPSQKVQDAVTMLEQTAESGMDEGITAMYALEAELPAIAQTKKDGLCSFYGLDSEDAQIYFDAHLHEEEHLKVWRSFSVNAARAETAATTSLNAQNQVLDAVCEACGISMVC